MGRVISLLIAAVLLCASAQARTSAHSTHTTPIRSSGTTRNSARPHKIHTSKASERCATCARDSHGRIKRSEAAKQDFMRSTGFPRGRKGYVVDHIVPLECGGADIPANMQWQTVEAAKAKDKTERRCR